VTSYGVIKDQKHDRACCRHYNAVKIEPRHTDVAENMKDPSSDDRAYHPQQHIEDNSQAEDWLFCGVVQYMEPYQT